MHNFDTLFSFASCAKLDLDYLSGFSSTSSMRAAFLFLGVAIPFLYSSSMKGYTSVTVVSVCRTECVRFA